MIATFINCVLVLVGSFLGLVLKGKLPQRFLDVLLQAMGLCVLTIGISGAIGTNDTLYYCFPQGSDVVTKARIATEELYKLKKRLPIRKKAEEAATV